MTSVFYKKCKKNNISLSWVTLKRHLSIGVSVVYIDTSSPVPNIPSKSRGLADENKKLLTEWKWLETCVLKMEFYVILKHEFITSDGHAKVIDKNRNLSPEKKSTVSKSILL